MYSSTSAGRILIADTGNAGDNLLVELFAALGFEIGCSREQPADIGTNSDAGRKSSPEKSPELPRVVKSPRLSIVLRDLAEKKPFKVHSVIIPIRSIDDAAEQAAVAPSVSHQLICTVAEYGLPHVLISFPKYARDADYTFRQLEPVLAPFGIERPAFQVAFARVAPRDLGSDFAARSPRRKGNSPAVLTTTTGPATKKELMVFHRDFRVFSGGHMKMFDYFRHVMTSQNFEPRIFFTKRSIWTSENPWLADRAYVSEEWPPPEGTPLFIGNMSWRFLPRDRHHKHPIINLVQHVRCSRPDHPHYETLAYPATRICVSADVADAIRGTGKVEGPVHVIPAGTDPSRYPSLKPPGDRATDILIVGYKRPKLGVATFTRLRELAPNNIRITLLDKALPRAAFLELLSDCRVALLLPNEIEGFYLPALEAMTLRCRTVCPDAVGNRSFCKPDVTCWMPDSRPDALAHAALVALAAGESEGEKIVAAAQQVANQFSLDRERQAVHELLKSWQSR